MSIVTKKGDQGETGLMYNRRVSKCHPRIEACGTVDELNAALGVARSASQHEFVCGALLAAQKDLVGLMGELATAREDLAKYKADGYAHLTSSMTARLESVVKEIESQKISFDGWATPGATAEAAALDAARTVCRRAERRVCALLEAKELPNQEVMPYLNRLSDLLWLLARWAETQASANPDSK